MKRVCCLLLLFVTGCSSFTGLPSATTGWQFTIGSPSLVHTPSIVTQTGPDATVTNLGTHVPQEQPMPKAASNGGTGLLPAPVVVKPARGNCDPCNQE